MINIYEVLETNKMIEQENLDVRTITMGINLLDCVDSDVDALCRKIYDKITRLAKDLVKTGEDISKEYGIPIVNKRVSITPVSLVGGSAAPARPACKVSQPTLCPITSTIKTLPWEAAVVWIQSMALVATSTAL